MKYQLIVTMICAVLTTPVHASDVGNRLTYLDEFLAPYHVDLHTSRLVTPQWVGEADVEAVIVLAIDDMADAAKYETFLRPILNRLKKIDGRAGVSIMTTHVDPRDPQLQGWIKEGAHIETHTFDHPCPCLQKGKLNVAKRTFDRSVDLQTTIPGNRPVAFRMPCCDSMNSVSPRFFAEVFNKATPAGNFLSIDSSIFQLFTPDDPALSRAMVQDADGQQKFRKYIPPDRMMINYVENYPYPYVIGRVCWEFPCLMPSDWDAQNLNGKCSPITVRDLKCAIDATVLKQGVFSLCFHPHGWIRNDQVIELIDHARKRYGKKVKFMNFAEVQQRLDQNLLGGQPLRDEQGGDNGVRVCDLDHDGYMDVIIANDQLRQTRIWSAREKAWRTSTFPLSLIAKGKATGARLGVLRAGGRASVLVSTESVRGAWHFQNGRWMKDPAGLAGLESDGPFRTAKEGRDQGVRLRDLDRDGRCELIISNPIRQAVFRFQGGKWHKLPFTLPKGMTIVDGQGRDAGLRFVDLDEDGHDDVVFSDARRYAAYVFSSMTSGWSRKILDGRRNAAENKNQRELPMIVRADGTNNGAWFKYRHMWIQNEDTGASMPHHIDHRCYTKDILFMEKKPLP